MATDFGFKAYDVDRYRDPFVFISYKSEDSAQVAVYARYLHDQGLNVWYDEGIKSGKAWDDYILSVIENPACKAVLLFVTSRIARSSFIPSETKHARDNKKPVVAIYLEPGLDLEVLLSKAIKVHVGQWQSINAYIGSQESVCAEILEAARGAMRGSETVSSAPADEIWNNARIFLLNYGRSRSEEDVRKARGFLQTMADRHPADYRGWLGLAICECLPAVESLEYAAQRLGNCARFYSYVVASGADSKASADYTRAKSRMWNGINNLIESLAAPLENIKQIQELREAAGMLGGHFGHTEPGERKRYEKILEAMDERVRKLEEEAKAEAERRQAERLRLQKEAEDERLRLKKEAEEKAITDQCEWETTPDGGVTLVKYKGAATGYSIPETVNGRRVTKIGARAFSGCTGLTSVTIPDSVTGIGDYAFSNCSELSSISIPDSVKSIGKWGFWCCKSLASVTVPKGVTEIASCTFTGCSNLVSVTIPNGVTSIGDGAFSGCFNLVSVTVPEVVTSIGDGAFSCCTCLNSVTILNSEINIHANAFIGCTDKKLTIYGTGGMFSKLRKTAKAMGIKYKKIDLW